MGPIIIPGQPEPEPDPETEPETYTAEISLEEVDRWVREAIARNRQVRRTTRSQESVDRTVEVLHEEGELHLAASLLLLMSARISGHGHTALSILTQLLVELKAGGSMQQECRVCGCTDEHACPGGCEWVEFDLCSACDRRLRSISALTTGHGPRRRT